MIVSLERQRFGLPYKILSFFIALTFVTSLVIPPSPARAQSVLNLPAPGVLIHVSPVFTPMLMRGIKIHPDNPLKFDFIVDSGDTGLEGPAFKQEAAKLIKYFLASLTIPEEDLWVNLSPHEEGRVIPEKLGLTEMGRDMLAQDYILKQLSASLTYPESDLGKEFWKRVRAKAREMYGTKDIPMGTFNKVWIVPERAEVFETNDTAFVADSYLKVMMEEDYLALAQSARGEGQRTNGVQDRASDVSRLASDIVKDLILPEIEKEVNEGKNFVALRQIYHSLILAVWFKQNLRESLLGRVYVNKSKIEGVDVEDKESKQKIYERYLAAYKKGAFNYIKDDEEYFANAGQVMPRKYFSGGEVLGPMTDQLVAQNTERDLAMLSPNAQDGILRLGKAGSAGRISRVVAVAEELPAFSTAVGDAAMATWQPGADTQFDWRYPVSVRPGNVELFAETLRTIAILYPQVSLSLTSTDLEGESLRSVRVTPDDLTGIVAFLNESDSASHQVFADFTATSQLLTDHETDFRSFLDFASARGDLRPTVILPWKVSSRAKARGLAGMLAPMIRNSFLRKHVTEMEIYVGEYVLVIKDGGEKIVLGEADRVEVDIKSEESSLSVIRDVLERYFLKLNEDLMLVVLGRDDLLRQKALNNALEIYRAVIGDEATRRRWGNGSKIGKDWVSIGGSEFMLVNPKAGRTATFDDHKKAFYVDGRFSTTALIWQMMNRDRMATAELISYLQEGGDIAIEIEHKLDSIKVENPPQWTGISGPPSVGKSTLTGEIVREMRRRDESVAVFLIDPTNTESGGAVLGDWVRLPQPLLSDEGVFIRSLATGGRLGGVVGNLEKMMKVMNVFGIATGQPMTKGVIETVGIGQVDDEIHQLVDTTVGLVPSGMTELTASKYALLDSTHIGVVTKADRAPEETVGTAGALARVLARKNKGKLWTPPVIRTLIQPGRVDGIQELVDQIIAHESFVRVNPSPSAAEPSEPVSFKGKVLVVELSSQPEALDSATELTDNGFDVIYLGYDPPDPEAAAKIRSAAIAEGVDAVHIEVSSVDDINALSRIITDLENDDLPILIRSQYLNQTALRAGVSGRPYVHYVDAESSYDKVVHDLEQFIPKKDSSDAEELSEMFEAIRPDHTAAMWRFLNGAQNASLSTLQRFFELKPASPGERSYRVAFTGSGGVGKSTLIAKVAQLLNERLGIIVGVVPVDPSRKQKRGDLLADRHNLNDLAGHDGIMVRSVGTSRPEDVEAVIRAMEAAGAELTIFETVGVGQQTEAFVVEPDTLITVSDPNTGEIQVVKPGPHKKAPINVLNQGDRKGATITESHLRSALISPPSDAGWSPRVLRTEAVHDVGILELVQAMSAHLDYRMAQKDGLMQGVRPVAQKLAGIEDLIDKTIIPTGIARVEEELGSAPINPRTDDTYAAGIHPTNLKGVYIDRTYEGQSTPEDTNRIFLWKLSRALRMGLSLALSGHTQEGIDSDNPVAQYDIGVDGAPIDSVEDMETVLAGIDMLNPGFSLSITINALAADFQVMMEAVGIRRLLGHDPQWNERRRKVQSWVKLLFGDEKWDEYRLWALSFDSLFSKDKRWSQYQGEALLWISENLRTGAKEGSEKITPEEAADYVREHPLSRDTFPALDVTNDVAVQFAEYSPLDEKQLRNSPITKAQAKDYVHRNLRLTVQNDNKKEFTVRFHTSGPYALIMRMVRDMVEYNLGTKINSFSDSGYHMVEAGATPEQEGGIALSNAYFYMKETEGKGTIEDRLPQLSFFLNSILFDETGEGLIGGTAKFRAVRRLWSRIVRHLLGAQDKGKAYWVRIHTQTSGIPLRADDSGLEEILNVFRIAFEGYAAILGGTQSLHLDAYDEARDVPGQEAREVVDLTHQAIRRVLGDNFPVDALKKEGTALLERHIPALVDELWQIVLDRMPYNGKLLKSWDQAIHDFVRQKIQSEVVDKLGPLDNAAQRLEDETDSIEAGAWEWFRILEQVYADDGPEGVTAFVRGKIQEEAVKKARLRGARLQQEAFGWTQELRDAWQTAGSEEDKKRKIFKVISRNIQGTDVQDYVLWAARGQGMAWLVDILEESLRTTPRVATQADVDARLQEYSRRRQRVVARLKRRKAARDREALAAAQAAFEAAVQSDDKNMMDALLESYLAGSTIEEVRRIQKDRYGDYSPGYFPASVSPAGAYQIKSARPIRTLIASIGRGGHTRGMNIIVEEFANAGMEVLYGGIWRTVDEVVKAAIEQDVDFIGLSMQSGARLHIITDLMKALKRQKAEREIRVVVGGNTQGLAPEMKFLGVAAVFDPIDKTGEVTHPLRFFQQWADVNLPVSPDLAMTGGEEAFLDEFIGEVRSIFSAILKGGPAKARARLKAMSKGDETPVTIYDQQIERLFHELLADRFPSDGVLGEELDWTRFERRMWTIDPIDGTRDFLAIGPYFGTLAGLFDHGQPRLGLGYWPRLKLDGRSLGSLVTAKTAEEGIRLNGESIKQAQIAAMNESKVVYISNPKAHHALREALKRYFEERGYTVRDTQGGGGEIAEMMLKGTAGLYVHLTPAGVDMPTNAFFAGRLGLKATDRFGNSIFPIRFEHLQKKLFFDSLVIGTPETHAEALAAFQSIGEPEEDLPWTDQEKKMRPVEGVRHFNRLLQLASLWRRSDPFAERKSAIKKRQLRDEMADVTATAVRDLRSEIGKHRELLIPQSSFERAVLDPTKGVLREIAVRFSRKSEQGKSIIVGEGGVPGAGKTTGGQYLAEAVAKETGAPVLIFREDRTLIQRAPVNLRGAGLEGKFRWKVRDDALHNLKNGRSVLVPTFDDVSGGNVMMSLDKGGNVVIYNGNRTITIRYRKGNSTFSYEEILSVPGKDPIVLTQDRRHLNIRDSDRFISGSTQFRIRIENNHLIVGFQSMEIVDIAGNGDAVLRNQLTDHVIDFKADTEASLRIVVPDGNDHLVGGLEFDLEVVDDPSVESELRKAKLLQEFMPTGTPVIFEGQFAFVRFKSGKFVRDASLYDIKINYRASRIIRWVRDWNRSAERGRTRVQQYENSKRFFDRAAIEERISFPAGADATQDIVQVTTTDLAESMQALVHYGREHWPVYRSLLEQLGVDPETIDHWQRENLTKPKLLELLRNWKDSVAWVRQVDGIVEYRIGDLLVRTEEGRSSLSSESVDRSEALRWKTNNLLGANTVVDLGPLGVINVRGGNAGFSNRRFGNVSVWNDGPLIGERLKELDERGDADSIEEGQVWIDEFIAREVELHRRGVVDSNPDIMIHRRILPVSGEMAVAIVSPERNLKIGKDALELYREQYILDKIGKNIYLRNEILEQIPENFREYYMARIQQTWSRNPGVAPAQALVGFFKNVFEAALLQRDRTPVGDLPKDLKPLAASRKVDVVVSTRQLRNWDVEHPLLFKARLDHMRFLYAKHFFGEVRRSYQNQMQIPEDLPPELVWTALFVSTYPDKFNKFYQLMSLFYEALLSNPDLLKEFSDDDYVRDFISEKYNQGYIQSGINPPLIDEYAWRSFNLFLAEARSLASASKVSTDLAMTTAPLDGTAVVGSTVLQPRLVGAAELGELAAGMTPMEALQSSLSSDTAPAPGGIDITQTGKTFRIYRDGKGVALPVSMQPPDVELEYGLTPLILEVIPMSVLPFSLSALEEKSDIAPALTSLN